METPVCSTTWCELSSPAPIALYPGPNLITLTNNDAEVLLDKIVAVPQEFQNVSSLVTYDLPAGCNFLKNQFPTNPPDLVLCQKALFTVTMYYWEAPLPCNCDVTGSFDSTCNMTGGQCKCQTGVVGRTCNKCSPSYYRFSNTGCTDCKCDVLSSACDSVTGQCQCPDNTLGRQCEFCLPNNWNWTKTVGCTPCACHPTGSLSLQCNSTTGVCLCKTGYRGSKCESCMDGFYRDARQECVPCSCDEAGSLTSVCNQTTGQCSCKENTVGRACTSCKTGTFGLSASNSRGCLSCVCMGITSDCTAANIKLNPAIFPLTVRTDSGEASAIKLCTENGTVYDMNITLDTSKSLSQPMVSLTEAQPRLYWQMPGVLLSNLLSLYGSDVTFTVDYIIVLGQRILDLKVILIDSSGITLTQTVTNFDQGVDTTHRIVLRESSWSKSSGNLTRGEFLKILYTAKVLLVPASFATGKHTSRLSKLEFSSVSDVGLVNPYVELCACGPQYTGRSCESCALGYKRANVTSSEYFGVCVPCDCNNHSNTCNPDTGVCLDCQHNTAGNSCETCKHGYYPHATNGCTQCPCYYPRVKNETCHTDNTTGSIVCDSCNVGYTGDLCDKCEPLYYGNPLDVNGTCSLCTCNGNSKTCNNVTGICDSCSNNTAGDHCEVCAVGFYGNASLQTCQECQCKASMSNSTVCDNITGQCPCFYGVGGRTCDQCLLGYWGYNTQNNTGCQFCGCLEAGSLNAQCDNTTGQCSCRNYTTGTHCNQCVEGYYGLPTLPCQACGCNVTGSVPGSGCNKTTGQCQCQPGVGGRQCDQCLPLYVNFTSAGCQECGPCQRSLGQDIQLLSGAANSVLNKTMLALNVQLEDPTLQVLTAKLNQSLNLLGLAGSNKSSITEVISSVDGQRSLLENGTQILELKVSSLVNSTSTSKNRSEMEVSRFSALKDQATNLSSDSAAVDQLLSKNLGVFDAYNQTASLYLSVRGNSTEDLALTFQPELSLATSLLATVQDTGIMANTNNIIYKQATTIANMSSSMISLSADLDAKSLAVSNLSSVLDTLDFSTSSVENTLAQANVFKSQADDVNRSVSDVLNTADMKYADMSSNFTAAKKSASNAETIYSANAASVMSWGDNRQFPIGVSNIVTGNLTLRNSLESTPPLIDKTALAVTQAEAHVTALEISYSEINRTYQNISTLGKAAVQIIDDFNTATQNLDSAVSMIQSADQLVLLIQGNITSELVDRMRAEFEAERNSSETLRNYVMAVDFQTQVLQNGVSTAANRINNELAQWSPAVVELDAMITAAQGLNTLYKDSPAAGQLSDAASKLQEAATVVQTAASSAASQDNVLNQKQGDIDTLYNQTDRALDLQKSLEQRLINQDSNLNVFKQNMTSASSLLQATDQTTKDIESKIAVLKKKMEMAEAALAKLRQPVTFDGNLGLQIVNPGNNVQRVFDDIVVDLRKPSNFSNGVFFYVDNPSSGAELQLGVANDTLYFEFSTGVQNVRVPSRFAGCDDCWVRLSATRYANVGHLAVTLLSTGGLVSDSVTAPDNSLAREITLNSALFIGSLPDTKETSKVRDRSFKGCLDNLVYQSQEINLWVTQSSGTSSRTCCQSPPALPSTPTVPGISFSGFGYITFSPGTLVLSDIMQVSLEFRTFSTSATMLSISSADGRTVYSVLIDSGLVVWVINVDGVQIRLQSQMPYATGRWAQVLTTREQQNLKLSVRYLDDPSSLNVDNYTVTFPLNLTPLNDMSILFGSNTVNLNNRNSIFAGCMRNVSLSSTSTTIRPNFVDNVTYSAGISTSGCYENVVSGLSFTTEMSYAQLQVKDPLQQINKLEMTIVTQEPNAVLLYIYASDSLRFLYLAVFGGNVVLVYRQNETSTVVSANNYISDGQQHTIVLDCTTLRVSVRIDNIVFEDTSQTLSVSYLTFPANVALYLGGVPEGTTLPPQCPVTQSAAGGITKLLINNNPVDLHQSSIISSKDVSLAGVQGTLSATPAPPVATPTPYTCAPAPNPAYLSLSEGILMSGANEINWSGLGANPNLLELFEGMFSLDIDFAIYKADGVILYVADMTNNPTYYFIIYVMNGKFHVAMKTSLNSYDLQVEESFNDAKRYSLTVLKSNDFLAVAGPLKNYINSGASPNITSSLTFPTSSGVFIGNIGPNVLPNSPLPRAFILQQSKVSFAGALYAVKLKTTAEIALPIMSLDRTKFPAIPAAVYYGISLSGVNSYLGLGTYTINTSLTIEVTMTTISESGLLFALFKDGKFVAVDVKSNQLKLHLSPSYPGITTPLTLTLDTSVRLCDGMIHNIKIEIDNSLATLTVDNVSRPSRVIPVSNALLGITDAQFYIAGLPEAVGALGIVTSSSIKSCVMSATLTTGTAEKVTFDPTQYASSSSGTSYSCPH
ncbi:laminin-like protein epi-1 [Physella acuta]|uniref:laminin-like protein epi-1 n=1 Tax=Physella acuta TaxID=109671 RepID=UPI0027DC997B|nr:laminin-like protein epi-1 [Physella acuta]